MKEQDEGMLERITARLQAGLAGGDGDETYNVPTKRGATKRPFNKSYRAWRRMRMRMQKKSRRINRRRS